MAEFDVARLITVLGARFDPTGFEAFDRAIHNAEAEAQQLRRELTTGYSTAALRDYRYEIERAQKQLEKLRQTTVQANAVQTPRGTRYQRPAGHEQAGKFVSASVVANEQRQIDEAIAKVERRIQALGKAAESTSRQVGTLAMAEERAAIQGEKMGDRVALALAKVQVAAGKADFDIKSFSAAEVTALENVAMQFERTSIAADNMRQKVDAGYARMTEQEERAAAQASRTTKKIHEMTAAERRSAVEAIHAAHGHSQWAHTLREVAGIIAVTFGAEQIYEQIKKTQEAANLFQEAQARLQVSMRNSGISWEEYESRIEETTHALREQSGFTDFEIQDSLANAIRATGHAGTAAERYAKAWRIVQTSLDVARTKHIGLQAATTLTAQATQGYARGLARLGITVTAATDHADKIRGTMAGQRAEFSKWLTEYRRWVGDQLAGLRYRRADALAVHAFVDATNKVIQQRREELGATQKQERAQVKAAAAADKALTGQRLLAALSSTFAGQAEAYGHTLSGAWARFKAQIDATRESTSRELLPALTQVVEYLSEHFVGRVGAEIDRLNDLWLDMGHSIRDIAVSFLPLLQGAALTALGAVRVFFAILAPTLHTVSELIAVVGGANIGVFVASWWAAGRAMQVFARIAGSVRTLLIAAAFRDAFVAFRTAPGVIGGASAALRAFGSGLAVLMPAIGPAGWIALGVAALATGIYYLSTRESDLARVNRELADTIRDVGSAFKEELDAIDRLNDANLTVAQQKLSIKATDAALIASEHQYTADVKKLSRDRATAATTEAKLRAGGASEAAISHYKAAVAIQIQDDKNKIKRDKDRVDELKLQRRGDILRLGQAKDFQDTARKQRWDAYHRTIREEQAFRKDIMRVSDPKLSQYVTAPEGSPLRQRQMEAAAAKATRLELQQLRRAEHGYYKDAQGHTVQLSGSFRGAARSVLNIYTALKKLPSRQVVNLMLRHGDLAPAIARMSKELGRPLNLAQVRFYIDHPKLRTQILDAVKRSGKWPKNQDLQPNIKIPPKSSFLQLAKRLTGQISSLLNPQLNAHYDPSQIDHMTATMRTRAAATWAKEMAANPFKIHFEADQQSQDLYKLLTGRGSMTVTWAPAGDQPAAGGSLTVPTQAPSQPPSPSSSGTGHAPAFAPPPTRRKTGGPITRPTFTLMGEEAPRFPEYVFSTNPRDLRHNAAAFAELAGIYGLRVDRRATGTTPTAAPPGGGGTPADAAVQAALDAALASEKGHATPRKRKKARRSPVDLFMDDINAASESYQEAWNGLDFVLAQAERTQRPDDDARINRGMIRLEQSRLRTIQRQLRDPRFRQYRTSGTQQDRNTVQQAYNGLVQEEASLYRDITTRMEAPDVDLTKILSPREQYRLDEAARRGDVKGQQRILKHELSILDRMRRDAVGRKQWGLADQISQQQASVQSQLEGLTGGTQQGADYIAQLQAEAQELLSPGAYFQRDVRAQRGVRTGHFAAPARNATPLSLLGAGQAPVQINVNTMHPGDPATLRLIHRAAGAATAQAPHRRNPRRVVRG